MDKPRKEQEDEFREYIEPYATISCMKCFGRGYTGWHIGLNQLIPCDCVSKNLAKIKAYQEKQKLEVISESN